MMHYVPSVLIYALRGDDVLLMHRNKEPNRGLWVAPGGKVEVGESPLEAARREMAEETGLDVRNLRLRGFCTEVSPLPEWQWFLFVYVTRDFDGDLCPDLREGALAWHPVERYLHHLTIPVADAIFAPRVLDAGADLFQAKFVYDRSLQLVEWEEYP